MLAVFGYTYDYIWYIDSAQKIGRNLCRDPGLSRCSVRLENNSSHSISIRSVHYV